MYNHSSYAIAVILFFVSEITHCYSQTDSSSSYQKVVVEKIALAGNKITRPAIIQRELIFHEGDTIPQFVLDNAIERSRENLLNTSLFNFVTITQQKLDGNKDYIIVDVTERWYVFPVPIFELVDRNLNEWWLNKDFSRTNYGFYLNWSNFRGRRETLKVLFRYGYSQRIGFSYSIPYINKSQNSGLSFAFWQSRNHEIAYTLNKSKLRYYKNSSVFVRKEYLASAELTHRDGIYKNYSISAEYHNNKVSDTIRTLNNDYYVTGKNTQKYFSLQLEYKDDHRDIKNYPLQGYFFDFTLVKDGFGFTSDDPNSLYTTLFFKKFWKLNTTWHTAASAKFKLSGQNDVPFFNQRALGYGGDVLRGYEYYVINGENYALLKSDLKFTLVQPHVYKVPVNVLKKFTTIPYALYLNAFGDAGYVRDKRFAKTNPLANTWQYSYGLGMDYVSYYDIVLRVDYSINRFGERGFFVHLTAPI